MILQYFSCKIIEFKSPRAQFFVYFGIFFSDSFLEHVFCRSWYFSVSLLAHFSCQKLFSEGFGRHREVTQKRVCRSWRELRNFEKGGEGPIITSGLWLSWVMVPLGPWSLERGRGVQLATGHALRSKRGGGFLGDFMVS